MKEKIARLWCRNNAVIELGQPFPMHKAGVSKIDARVAAIVLVEPDGLKPGGFLVMGDMNPTVPMRDKDGKLMYRKGPDGKPAVYEKPGAPGIPGVCSPGFACDVAVRESEQYKSRRLVQMFCPLGADGIPDIGWEFTVEFPAGLKLDATPEQIGEAFAKIFKEEVEAQATAARIAAEEAGFGGLGNDDEDVGDDFDPTGDRVHSYVTSLVSSNQYKATTPEEMVIAVRAGMALHAEVERQLAEKAQAEMAAAEAEARRQAAAELDTLRLLLERAKKLKADGKIDQAELDEAQEAYDDALADAAEDEPAVPPPVESGESEKEALQ